MRARAPRHIVPNSVPNCPTMSLNTVTILFGLGWGMLTAGFPLVFARRPVSPWLTLVAGLVSGVSLLALALAFDYTQFALVHIVYLMGTLGPTVVAAVLAIAIWRGWYERSAGSIAFVGLLAIPGPLGLWATHVAPFQLQVERVEVPLACARAGDDDVTIGVLADIQTPAIGEYERDAIARLIDEQPDLIVIAGDIQQGTDPDYAEFTEFLSTISAPHGVYVVQGDVDTVEEFTHMIPDNVTWLHNDVAELKVGDRTIRLGGNERDWLSTEAAAMQAELATSGPDTVTIQLTHRPDPALDLNGEVDVVIAGHTHGGQVAIPFVGPLHVASDVPLSVGGGGLHDLDGQTIYVSTGVGMERLDAPQVRLFVPPSMGMLTLTDGEGCS